MLSDSHPQAAASSQQPLLFPIVALGASAGGVEALRSFTSALPTNAGVAVIVVLHLPAKHTSELVDILARDCAVPVVSIEDGMALACNQVHVLPPGASVEWQESGRLRLEERADVSDWRPVDRLFNSLTMAGERAVAVVLSGTGTNGSVAINAIKSAGGIALAQDPDESGFPEMPRNAIATGLVDQVAGCAELAAAVVKWGQRLPQIDRFAADESSETDQALAFVQAHTGRDFRGYKRGTIERRIQRRTSMCFCDSVGDYLELLRSDDQEIDRLAQDLLIGVTAFFRDTAVWETIAEKVLPDLLQGADQDRPFRAWVAGCSTGQEAYTLAIVVQETMERYGIQRPVQIFATDIDHGACDKARQGMFPANLVSGLDQHRLGEHFTRENNHYRISQPIRDMITFAHHNLLRDPPFSQIDLVTCRNVLIYLDNAAQEQVLGIFHFALRQHGILLLGGSETAQRQENLFHSFDDTNRCYRRRDTPTPPPAFSARHRAAPLSLQRTNVRLQRQRHSTSRQALAQDLATRYFAPAFVLVDEDLQVCYYSGPTGAYLHQPQGTPNDDLLSICDSELGPRLHGGLHQASQKNGPITLRYAPADTDGESGEGPSGEPSADPVQVSIQPVSGQEGERLWMVSFRPLVPHADESNPTTEAVDSGELDARRALEALDLELRANREELSTSIEELETSNEELKASNEEVRSMYEELQSTNEELETSREELQAVNEELGVVNGRLKDNLWELANANDVLNNLLSSTNLPTVFLDRNLRIQRFTPAAERLMRLIDGDIGRPLEDIADRISDGHIIDDAQHVLETLIPQEREIRAKNGAWYILRVHPYRTADDRIEGVVATLSDISQLKQTEHDLRASEHRYRRIFDNAAVGMAQLDENGCIKTCNRTLSSITGVPYHLLANHPLADLFIEPHCSHLATAHRKHVRQEGSELLELPLRVKDGQRWLRCTLSGSGPCEESETAETIVIVEDISGKHAAETHLKRRSEELQRSNEDLSHFAAMASHDLQAPLRLIGSYIDIIDQLDDQLDEDKKHEYYRIVQDNVQHMRRLIVDVLDFARLEMSEQVPEPCDCQQAVDQACASLQEVIAANQASVETHDLPQVRVPPRLLSQLFQNLIENAIKYRRDEPPRVVIDAERMDQAWCVRVTDNGRGIQPAHIDRIFDLFNRSGSEVRSAGGTGLGLAICRKGIERIGGRIWCESELGVGSVFAFTIPD